MTCAESDRVSYEAILSEQREARAALLEANAGPRPLTLHQHGLAMWLADLVADEIFSFGEAEPQAPEPDASAGGSAAARAPNELTGTEYRCILTKTARPSNPRLGVTWGIAPTVLQVLRRSGRGETCNSAIYFLASCREAKLQQVKP